MLERLRLTMEEQQLGVEVAVRNRRVLYAVWHGEMLAPLRYREMESGRKFLRHLERTRLSQWKKSYVAEEATEKVLPWRLELMLDGVRRVIAGDSYPEDWAAFVDVMNELPGVALPKVNQIEQLQILYEGPLLPVTGNVYAPRLFGGLLTEKLAISRGKHILILTRHKQGFGTERHAFDSVRNVPLLLKRVEGALTGLAALAIRPEEKEKQEGAVERLELRFFRRTGEEYLLRFAGRETWPEPLSVLLREIAVLTYDVKSDLLAKPDGAAVPSEQTVADAQKDAKSGEGQA